jgi:hypothetical protein
MSKIAFVCVSFICLCLTPSIVSAQPGEIVPPYKSCADCDNWFPLNTSCQWVECGTPWCGLYYELNTTAWDNSCHTEGSSLPYTKSFSFSTPAQQKRWTLLPDSFSVNASVEFFAGAGLTANWESEPASVLTDTYSGSCGTDRCCLPKLYVYCVYDYTQKFFKRQVFAGTPASGHWRDCSDSSMRKPVLLKFKAPEVLTENRTGYTPPLY